MASESSSVNWTPETEVCLFYAMRGQKPTGINKHFHMICIHKKFCDSYGQQVPTEKIWQHLNTMYNMKALDDSEASPVRNVKQEFKLPSEIINFKFDQTRYSLEDAHDDDFSQKSSTPKSSRKRPRGSPAPITVKRRRQ